MGLKTVEADGQATAKTLSLRVDKIVGQYAFNSATTKGRLVLNTNYSAEMWINDKKALTGKWYVSGGALGTNSEIWFVATQYHLLLSVDITQKPFSLKSVANFRFNPATQKINRIALPPQGQMTYTRSQDDAGQGPGAGQEPGMGPVPGPGPDGQ